MFRWWLRSDPPPAAAKAAKEGGAQVTTFTRASWRVLIPFAVLALLVASGAVGLTAEQHLRRVTGFAVYDARGKLVADVLNWPDPDRAFVAMKINERLLTFVAMREGLLGANATIGTPLLYESADCSGQAFDAHNPDDLGGYASWAFPDVVFTNGLSVYLADGAPRPMQTNSVRDEVTGVCQQLTIESTPQQPVTPFAVLPFQAPFTLRAVTAD
jgi:hypothetical protein